MQDFSCKFEGDYFFVNYFQSEFCFVKGFFGQETSLKGFLFSGWGWTEYQKCPSIFFILCGYIGHVCIYTQIYSQKLSAQISCGFKILVKLGGGMQKFKNTLQVGFFKNRTKSRHSNFTELERPFYEKFSIILLSCVHWGDDMMINKSHSKMIRFFLTLALIPYKSQK